MNSHSWSASNRPATLRVLLPGGSVLRWVATAACLALLAACRPASPTFESIDITGAPYAQGFRLTDATSTVRTLADYKGKIVVVFFGFTQCPDVCPTTLSKLVEVKSQLGADGDKLQPVFITIDPERDTRQVIANYIPAFDPAFVGLTGTSAEVAETAKDFKVFYQKVAGQTPTSYTMDHTAGIFVFDTTGRIRLFVRHEQSAESIASDVRKLLHK